MEWKLNWLLLFKENFNTLVTVLGTFLGVIVGSTITVISQKNFFQKQIEWDKIKLKDEKLAELLTIYNNILMIHGENNVVSYYYSGNKQEINSTVYMNKVRPLLFEKYHLLHLNIAEIVNEIDEILLKWTVLEEESYEGEMEYVATLYLDIIKNINNYVNLSRYN